MRNMKTFGVVEGIIKYVWVVHQMHWKAFSLLIQLCSKCSGVVALLVE